MKTLFYALLLAPVTLFTQVLLDDNFNDYPTGPVSTTDITGETVGENGFKVFSGAQVGSTTTNMDENSAQFIEYNDGKALQLRSPDGNLAQCWVEKDVLLNFFTKNEENNVIIITYDLTQTTDNPSHLFVGGLLQNIDFYEHNIVAGLAEVGGADVIQLSGFYQEGEQAASNYFFNLEPSTSLTPFETTTFTLGFDYLTGEIYGEANGSTKSLIGASGEIVPMVFIYFIAGFSDNTGTNNFVFDNFRMIATNDPLGTKDPTKLSEGLSTIYPNPVKEVLNIKLGKRYNANKTQVKITDMSGKLIKSFRYTENSVMSDLTPGVYIINITDGYYSESQKMIKK